MGIGNVDVDLKNGVQAEIHTVVAYEHNWFQKNWIKIILHKMYLPKVSKILSKIQKVPLQKPFLSRVPEMPGFNGCIAGPSVTHLDLQQDPKKYSYITADW